MSKFNFTENVTNKELLENVEFKALLDKGEPVVYLVGQPKQSAKDGKMYFKLHVAQFKELGKPNEMDKLFLGLDSMILIRCWRNIDASQLENPQVANFCKVGAVLSDIVIIANDSTTPTSAMQKPRKVNVLDSTTGLTEEYVYTFEGKPVYRAMELAYKADGKLDNIITPDDRVKVDYESKMTTFYFTENSTNKELLENEEFKALLEQGMPVVYHVSHLKVIKNGKSYVKLYLAQFREIGIMDELIRKLWGDEDLRDIILATMLVRTTQLTNPEVVKLVKVGAIQSHLWLMIKDTLIRHKEAQLRTQTRGSEKIVLTYNGQIIYREKIIRLITNSCEDTIITSNGQIDYEPSYEPSYVEVSRRKSYRSSDDHDSEESVMRALRNGDGERYGF